MLEYGYDNYRMTVGEALGNGEEESVRTFSLEEASQSAFRFPNCLILQRNKVHPRPFGIPESEFHLLLNNSLCAVPDGALGVAVSYIPAVIPIRSLHLLCCKAASILE